MLILLRHGQTEVNAGGRLQGRIDAPLTALGREQAVAAAAGLGRIGPPTRVVSSPLRRARETAEAFGLPVEVDERWIELDYGDLDGVPAAASATSSGTAGGATRLTCRRAASRSSISAAGCEGRVRTSRVTPPVESWS
jgi:bisphosphoglycerate-dependent phosphoglycerate mutase